MKTLQNDFTTPEQSKRLLKLGVPADSANYAYMINETGDMCRVFINYPYTKHSEHVERLLGRKTLPCWSVGRLQEIFAICYTGEPFKIWCNDDIFLPENLIGGMEIRINEMDFSKLED